MKFHSESTAKKKVMEKQLKNSGPVLPVDARSETLLEVQTLVFGQFEESPSRRVRSATTPVLSLSR
jgi:hypothetical protein